MKQYAHFLIVNNLFSTTHFGMPFPCFSLLDESAANSFKRFFEQATSGESRNYFVRRGFSLSAQW